MIGDRFHVFLCCKDKTASFVITLAHDMESWVLKMPILLKLHLFISNPLDFLFCVMFSSHSNSENHSCNFLKLCESAANMMRIYVCYGYQLIEYVIAYWQTGISSRNWAQQFSFKDGDINVLCKQPFLSASSSLLPKCLQSSVYVIILVWA